MLDYQSRTSVALVKILATEFWKIKPDWIPASLNFENDVVGTTAALIIGDRTFGLENKYKFSYDLAEEWQKFTGLPFVFACWVANKQLPSEFISAFNNALKKGLDMRVELIKELEKSNIYNTDIGVYLYQKIDYHYDKEKKQALELFLKYLANLEQ